MNIIDRLLASDLEQLQEGLKKKYEIKRLTEKLGESFIVECRPLTAEQTNHLIEISNGSVADIKLNAIVESCTIEGRKLNDEVFIGKFKCLTGKEVVEKLFLIGEISVLYDTINEISGYGKDCVAEIKNS